MNACIIDDEWICRLIFKKLLERTAPGSKLTQFDNGQDAIEFISESQSRPDSLPELIFLDINMPVANGWQFLDLLPAHKPDEYNPVIYMATSSPDPDDLDRSKTYPAITGYLQKPVTQAMLEVIFQDLGNCQTAWTVIHNGSMP